MTLHVWHKFWTEILHAKKQNKKIYKNTKTKQKSGRERNQIAKYIINLHIWRKKMIESLVQHC